MSDTPAPSPAPAPAPAPAPSPTPAPAPTDWVAGISNEETRGWVTSKGFKDPGAVAESARNLERLVGGGLDTVVQLPKDPTAENMRPVYERLGMPKTAKEYKLPVPQGADPKFAETAAGWFHEAGLSAKQAEALATKWNEHIGGMTKAQADERAKRNSDQLTALFGEWGQETTPEYQARAAFVDKFAAASGMTAAQLAALKEAMGPGDAMRWLHGLGTKLGTEGTFVEGGNKTNSFGAMTPAQAQAKLTELGKDRGWVAKFATGDRDAINESKRLNEIIANGVMLEVGKA